MPTAAMTDKDQWLDLFAQFDNLHEEAPYQALRQAGRDRFRDLPLPSSKTEDWRFTSLHSLWKTSLDFAQPSEVEAAIPALPTADAVRLVFVNGRFQENLSRIATRPGVQISPLSQSEGQAAQLGKVADLQHNVFTALNTGLFHDGAFVRLDDDKTFDAPIDLLFVTDAKQPVYSAPRVFVQAGKHSRCRIIERYLGPAKTYFTNAVTEFFLADGAAIDHYKLLQEGSQAFHIANTQATLRRGSNFTSHYFALGGALVRNEVRVRFDGEGAEATVNGLYLGSGQQHLDNHTVIDHAVPHCNSHEVYKGILMDRAHGVFNGKIFVRKDAQKTDAKQTNKVLLLSDEATINTKPQLEIFADDVKCTHGATVGQLDESQLFYLRSRGLDPEAARNLLIFAFANDIVGRVQVESIRDELERVLIDRKY